MIQATDQYLYITGRIEVMGQEQPAGSSHKRLVDVRADDGRLFQFEFFGRDISPDMDAFDRGDEVEVQFDIRQREYNGRVYTNLAGKFLTRLPAGSEDAPQATEATDGEMPF